MRWHYRYNFSSEETFDITMITAPLEYLDVPLNNVKLMTIIPFNHKLVLAAAHWPGLC